MDIYSPHGTKVIFAFPDNGYEPDIKRAKEYLAVGFEYTVDSTIVHGSYTDVILKEFPNVKFNSVQFKKSH